MTKKTYLNNKGAGIRGPGVITNERRKDMAQTREKH